MKRINVILPEQTIELMDSIAPKGNRSRLISDAVIYYVTSKAQENLAGHLKQGVVANAQRDLELAREWFPKEGASWQADARGK